MGYEAGFDNQERVTGPSMGNRQDPFSWMETLAGVALFLVFGAFLILEEIPVEWIAPQMIPLRMTFLLAVVLFPSLALSVGWMRGFPRWSFAYLGAILFSSYLARSFNPYFSLFGIPLFGGELPGTRAWIPLLIPFGAGLLVTRSLRPLSTLVGRVNRDLTLITYAMFGLMPFFVFISFDEIARLYSLPWIVVLSIQMACTALIYLRSRSQGQRVASLSAGILLSLLLMIMGPALYQVGWVDLPLTLIWAIFIAAFMLVPAFFALAQGPAGVDSSNHFI